MVLTFYYEIYERGLAPDLIVFMKQDACASETMYGTFTKAHKITLKADPFSKIAKSDLIQSTI